MSTIGHAERLVYTAIKASRKPIDIDRPGISAMDISFPHDKPGIYTLNGTVAFPAMVNGKNVSCEVSEEVLKEYFGGEPPSDISKSEYDLAMVAAFEASRAPIEAAAARYLARNPDRICLLKRADFQSETES
jgi:Protein of unknown function (DUF1488)